MNCVVFIGAFAAYETYNFIKYTAMHEITHLLGADDHGYTNEACIHVSSYIGVDENTGMSAANDKKIYRYVQFVKILILTGNGKSFTITILNN